MATNSTRQLFKLSKQFTTVQESTIKANATINQHQFCNNIAEYFQSKIQKIRDSLDPQITLTTLPTPTSVGQLRMNNTPQQTLSKPTEQVQTPIHITPQCAYFSSFQPVTPQQVLRALQQLGPASSPLDPLPTPVMKTIAPEILKDLTQMINSSLTSGSVPSAWKRGIVTPLLKKKGADPEDPSNYRPVTQLTLLARLTEHFATTQIQDHLEKNGLLHDAQSGFRPSRSTEYATADVRETLLWNADQHQASVLILLDLSAAFDTVQHTILLDRCEQIAGITSTAKQWLQSFLEQRTQQVKMGPHWSVPSNLTCGVPQGSSLSPVLFNIYIQPLATLLEHHQLKFQMYADDVQIVTNLQTQERERLIPCLQHLKTWMTNNYLQLNSQKTELIVNEGKRTTGTVDIPWPPDWGQQPKPSTQVRDLGMILNTKGDGAAHAATTSKSCHHQLNVAATIFPLLEHQQRVLLAQAWVNARLNYGSFLHLGATKKSIRRLVKVQNRAVRLIFSLGRREHISPWRRKLGWLNIQDLVEYRLCTWLWRLKKGQGPHYAQQWSTAPRTSRTLRSLHQSLLAPRKFNKMTKGGRTIGHQGAKIWNRIPLEIRNLASFISFKKTLKAFLLQRELQSTYNNDVIKPSQQLPNALRGNTFTSAPDIVVTHLPRLNPIGKNPLENHKATSVLQTTRVSPPPSAVGPTVRIQPRPLHVWGVSSPPLPARNNRVLIQTAEANKKRLRDAGIY